MIEYIDLGEIEVKRVSTEYADEMFAFTSNPSTSRFLTWKPHQSVKEDIAYIKSMNEKDEKESIYRGIFIKKNNRLIGCIHVYNLSWKNMHAEVSYIINPDYSGKGYVTRAVGGIIDELFANGFIRIQALTIESNTRSEALMKRLGMSYEGTLKDYVILSDQKAYNMKIYSICKGDRLPDVTCRNTPD